MRKVSYQNNRKILSSASFGEYPTTETRTIEKDTRPKGLTVKLPPVSLNNEGDLKDTPYQQSKSCPK